MGNSVHAYFCGNLLDNILLSSNWGSEPKPISYKSIHSNYSQVIVWKPNASGHTMF